MTEQQRRKAIEEQYNKLSAKEQNTLRVKIAEEQKQEEEELAQELASKRAKSDEIKSEEKPKDITIKQEPYKVRELPKNASEEQQAEIDIELEKNLPPVLKKTVREYARKLELTDLNILPLADLYLLVNLLLKKLDNIKDPKVKLQAQTLVRLIRNIEEKDLSFLKKDKEIKDVISNSIIELEEATTNENPNKTLKKLVNLTQVVRMLNVHIQVSKSKTPNVNIKS